MGKIYLVSVRLKGSSRSYTFVCREGLFEKLHLNDEVAVKTKPRPLVHGVVTGLHRDNNVNIFPNATYSLVYGLKEDVEHLEDIEEPLELFNKETGLPGSIPAKALVKILAKQEGGV